ncbi:hypothetical protein [Leptospira haakeii]|uniref:Lipoprotein n=1 Tax=Leptospira haakeii TaxID=2023198 RepID=A0ABX4PN03_9LEPT|nr:hypothetical protein [Leptospira haakeii]PKA16403.1 hypothetical protein CH363_09815 [Leptospira haakeii]PKA19715.1 hypothetical protein CH377_10030 [Leptospira haakeii]
MAKKSWANKGITIASISLLLSCDGILRIENNVFIRNKINSKSYLSKFTGECDIYFNLLKIKGVAFTPNPEKIIYRAKVYIEDGILEHFTITWSKESKYRVHLKCPNYKEVIKEFDYPSIEPRHFYFELEE